MKLNEHKYWQSKIKIQNECLVILTAHLWSPTAHRDHPISLFQSVNISALQILWGVLKKAGLENRTLSNVSVQLLEPNGLAPLPSPQV